MPKTSSGSPHFPEVPTAIPSSSREVIDKALELLQARKDAWVSVGVADRIAVLDEIKRNMLAVAGRWEDAPQSSDAALPADAAIPNCPGLGRCTLAVRAPVGQVETH